jgi:hypothetical protein
MVCDQCNSKYEILVDVDAKEMISAVELDMEIPYCPFCGCECEWRDGFDDVDL